jgi:hypothetical protein
MNSRAARTSSRDRNALDVAGRFERIELRQQRLTCIANRDPRGPLRRTASRARFDGPKSGFGNIASAGCLSRPVATRSSTSLLARAGGRIRRAHGLGLPPRMIASIMGVAARVVLAVCRRVHRGQSSASAQAWPHRARPAIENLPGRLSRTCPCIPPRTGGTIGLDGYLPRRLVHLGVLPTWSVAPDFRVFTFW